MTNLMKAVDQIAAYLSECKINSENQYQHLSGAGPVFHFEEKLRQFYNKKFVVTFSSATTAMDTVCLSLGINNSEIIASPISWGGALAPFFFFGNKIHFTSFDPLSFNMDEENLNSTITPKSKVILSIDYGGTPANSKDIKAFSKEHGLVYISDSAQSLGSYRDEKPAGYYADITILSFSPGKAVYAGEGGAILTDNESLYEKIVWFSQHPLRQKTVFGLSNINEYAPINGRLNPLSAILLNETFKPCLKAFKKKQYHFYDVLQYLDNQNLIELTPLIKSPNASSYFSFSVQLKPNVSIQEVNDQLINQNFPFKAVQSGIKIIPFHVPFIEQFKGRFSISKKLFQQEKHFSLSNKVIIKYSP